jgi:hypothetical protein
MSSTDDGPVDAILLFQFSRTQNVVYHWKFRQPILQMHSMLEAGILVVANKLLELQKIFNCSYSKTQLKSLKEKRRQQVEEAQVAPVKRVNFSFVAQNETVMDVASIHLVLGT